MARDLGQGEWDKYVRRLGLSLLHLGRSAPGGEGEGPTILDLRFKLDHDNRTSVLLVMKAEGESDTLVGFIGGHDLATVVIAAAKKVRAGAVNWRRDVPWSERAESKARDG